MCLLEEAATLEKAWLQHYYSCRSEVAKHLHLQHWHNSKLSLEETLNNVILDNALCGKLPEIFGGLLLFKMEDKLSV